MLQKPYLFALFLIAFVVQLALVSCQGKPSSCEGQVSRDFLENLRSAGENDQRVRRRGTSISDQLEVDKANSEWLLSILDNDQLPAACAIGKKGVTTVWLIAQHSQDNDIRRRTSNYFQEAAEKGYFDTQNLASFIDRLELVERGEQIYGTQYVCDSETGERTRRPVRDPEKLNERRAEMGLNSAEAEIRWINTFRGKCQN